MARNEQDGAPAPLDLHMALLVFKCKQYSCTRSALFTSCPGPQHHFRLLHNWPHVGASANMVRTYVHGKGMGPPNNDRTYMARAWDPQTTNGWWGLMLWSDAQVSGAACLGPPPPWVPLALTRLLHTPSPAHTKHCSGVPDKCAWTGACTIHAACHADKTGGLREAAPPPHIYCSDGID